jgi:hypothetical protein
VNEPLKVVSDANIVAHYLFESFVIGDHNEVDEDDIAESQFVDDAGDTHLTERVEDDDSAFRVAVHVLLDFLERSPCRLHLCHWKKDQLDWTAAILQSLLQIEDRKHLHVGAAEAFERDQLF